MWSVRSCPNPGITEVLKTRLIVGAVMHVRTLTLAVAIAAALTMPAVAQQGAPLQTQFPGPSVPHWGNVPSPADVRKANEAENPAVRSVAQGLYEQLTAGQLNRSKLTQDVNAAFADSTESALSRRLRGLGSPTWSFVRNAQTSAGTVAIYSLKYSAGSAYMTIGVDDNGVVYALGFTKVQ